MQNIIRIIVSSYSKCNKTAGTLEANLSNIAKCVHLEQLQQCGQYLFVSSQEAQVFITASQQDEVTEEQIMAAIAKIRPPMEKLRRPSRAMDKEETVVSYHNSQEKEED